MTQPRPGGGFEPYPWTNPDEPERPGAREAFADEPQDPSPSAPLPPSAPMPYAPPPLPYATPPEPPRKSGVTRRVVIAGALGAGLAGLIGLGAVNNPSPLESPPEASAPATVPWDDQGDSTTAVLDTPDSQLMIDVPGTWEVAGENDLLLVVASNDHAYRVTARVPERLGTTENDLKREADYLRDEFEPEGESVLTDESTSQYDLLRLRTAGTELSSKAVEQTTLIVDPERSRGLVVSLVLPTDAEADLARQARSMVDDLLRQFKES